MPTIESAELKHGAGGAPVFVYEFGNRSSVMGGRLGATRAIRYKRRFPNATADALP